MKKLVLGATLAGLLAAGPAMAADLPVSPPYKAPAVMAPVYSWTGFYIGGNVGYSASDRSASSLSLVSPGFAPVGENFSLAPSGWLGGAGVGYNWQMRNWVFGVEGDWQWTGQKDSFCGLFACSPTISDGFTTVTERLSWFATARGRVGYAVDRTLFYVTGGGAWAKVKTDIAEVCPTGCGPNLSTAQSALGSFSDTKAGWVVGGGIESAVWRNWTVKAEYLHLDLGTLTRSVGVAGGAEPFTTTLQSRIRDNIFRVGVNYHFGWDDLAMRSSY
jgi:outer membrane immunogenic protein